MMNQPYNLMKAFMSIIIVLSATNLSAATTTITNNTPYPISGEIIADTLNVSFLCDSFSVTYSNPVPGPLESGKTAKTKIDSACLITSIRARNGQGVLLNKGDGEYIRCNRYKSSGTGYRTFQVVMNGANACHVNRP